MNLRNLERVLAREEEVKKRAIVHKAVYSGPQVRYYSKDGKFFSFCFIIVLNLEVNSQFLTSMEHQLLNVIFC